LGVYADIRRHLAEALGLDPGDPLQRLHHDILTGESGELERYDRPTDRVSASAGPPTVPAPRELPADVGAFTGREQHLSVLDELLDRPSSTVVISAVSGAGGVGKTALAVHWAHRAADRFPDGQLYIDLGGYDRAEPVAPAAALARFLRSLGLDGAYLPQDEAELAARYRSMMAGRRMIVVLDNARTAEQVRPLLPGTADNLVVVTSRDDLAGLVARDGARRVDVDLMSPKESLALLRVLIGPAVEQEPAAAAELAARCGQLPLALRIAAELSRSRPDVSLAEIVEDLRAEHRRLDRLDDSGDLRAVFGWSVRHLSAEAASAFTLLGTHPGRDVDLYALAALTGADLDRARRTASELVRSNIINATGPSRYAMHDLMRSYAAERAAAEIEPATARAALDRLFRYYLFVAAAAVQTTYPHLTDECLRRGDPQWPVPAVTQPDAAQRWLDVERANLTAMAGLEGDWPHRLDLSLILHRYLIDQAHHGDALIVHRAATAQTGDRDGHVLNNLATTLYRRGDVEEAIDYLHLALDRARGDGDAYAEGRALGNLGFIESCRGEYRAALGHQAQALDAYRRAGIRHLEAMTFVQMGYAKECLGRYVEAAEAQHAALAICREHDLRLIEGYAWGALGSVYGHLGREREAIELIERCLEVCGEFNDEASEVGSQVDLGRIHREQGRYPEALARLELAHSIAERIGQPYLQALSLNGLGDALRAMGRPSDGLARHRAAFAVAGRLRDRYQSARALDGLAGALDAQGDRLRAARLWRRALSTYAELGVPEAFALRQRLADAVLIGTSRSGK